MVLLRLLRTGVSTPAISRPTYLEKVEPNIREALTESYIGGHHTFTHSHLSGYYGSTLRAKCRERARHERNRKIVDRKDREKRGAGSSGFVES